MDTNFIAKSIVNSNLKNILEESALIHANVDSIEIDASVYDMYRMLQAISNPDAYVDNAVTNGNGIMLFNNEYERENTTKLLDKLGIKYKNTGLNNSKAPPKENNKSPYPSNEKIIKY